MNNKKTITFAAIAALLCSVIGGAVVFAALSSTLNINGSAEFQPESWRVRFKGSTLSTPALGNGGLTGTAEIETAPTLSDTTVGDYNIILKQPGDSATYTFFIENTGDLDATLSTLTQTIPTCEGTDTTKAADEVLICGSGNLTYTMKYVGGDLEENNLSNGQIVTQGDALKSETEVQVELKLAYSTAATEQPTNAVIIGGLNKTLIYTVAQQ